MINLKIAWRVVGMVPSVFYTKAFWGYYLFFVEEEKEFLGIVPRNSSLFFNLVALLTLKTANFSDSNNPC